LLPAATARKTDDDYDEYDEDEQEPPAAPAASQALLTKKSFPCLRHVVIYTSL